MLLRTTFGTRAAHNVHQIARRILWKKAFFFVNVVSTAMVVLALLIAGLLFKFDAFEVRYLDENGNASLRPSAVALTLQEIMDGVAGVYVHHFYTDGASSHLFFDIFLLLVSVQILTAVIVAVFPHKLYGLMFRALHCPNCARSVPLVRDWFCVTDCPPSKRHALAPCPTCGMQWQGIECPSCSQWIVFDENHDEHEIINREKKYIATKNPFYFGALIGIVVSGLWLMASLAVRLPVIMPTWGALGVLVVCIVLVVRLTPKRLVRNPKWRGEEKAL